MPLRIAIQSTERIAIDLAGVTPESIAASTLDDVRRTKVRQGNREVEFGELFTVSGDPRESWAADWRRASAETFA